MNNTYYDEKIETLPENLQDAVINSGWQESLVLIQQKFKLHIDQTQVLEDSTMRLMFGDIDAPDFINHMFSDAHINSELAADILLEVDLKILKKIREELEQAEKIAADEKEIEEFLLDEEERKARIENEVYANYYAEVEKIREEDDASPEDEEEQEIPSDIGKEKSDLLSEINEPTKSFIHYEKKAEQEPVITPAPTPITAEIPVDPIPVDHQLENTHLEEPFHEEDIIPELPKTPEQITSPTPAPAPIQPTSEIKKPISIKLDDIYREPIE